MESMSGYNQSWKNFIDNYIHQMSDTKGDMYIHYDKVDSPNYKKVIGAKNTTKCPYAVMYYQDSVVGASNNDLSSGKFTSGTVFFVVNNAGYPEANAALFSNSDADPAMLSFLELGHKPDKPDKDQQYVLTCFKHLGCRRVFNAYYYEQHYLICSFRYKQRVTETKLSKGVISTIVDASARTQGANDISINDSLNKQQLDYVKKMITDKLILQNTLTQRGVNNRPSNLFIEFEKEMGNIISLVFGYEKFDLSVDHESGTKTQYSNISVFFNNGPQDINQKIQELINTLIDKLKSNDKEKASEVKFNLYTDGFSSPKTHEALKKQIITLKNVISSPRIVGYNDGIQEMNLETVHNSLSEKESTKLTWVCLNNKASDAQEYKGGGKLSAESSLTHIKKK